MTRAGCLPTRARAMCFLLPELVHAQLHHCTVQAAKFSDFWHEVLGGGMRDSSGVHPWQTWWGERPGQCVILCVWGVWAGCALNDTVTCKRSTDKVRDLCHVGLGPTVTTCQ